MSSSKRKKERRLIRHLRNVKKDTDHKKEAWESGKFILENHNGGPFSPDYCLEFGKRLVDRITEGKTYVLSTLGEDLPEGMIWDNMTDKEKHDNLNERFVRKFRLYRIKSIEFLLHYNPDLPKNGDYNFIKHALEVYWDERENLIDLV